MVIRQLHLTNFGKFSNETIRFHEGMNILYGENEAGKSTIFNFIIGMFYGFYKPYVKNRRLLEVHEKYNPWVGGGYLGSLVFYDEKLKKEFRIERNFDAKKESVQVFEVETGIEVTDRYPIHPVFRLPDVASEHLGVSYTTFVNTLAVGQLGHETDENMDKELKESVVNAASSRSLDVSVHKVHDKLTKQLDAIGSMRRKTSNYYLKKQKIDKLEDERKEAGGINDQIVALKEQEKKLEDTRPEILEQLKQVDGLKKKQVFLKELALYNKASELKDHETSMKAKISELGASDEFAVKDLEETIDGLKQIGFMDTQISELEKEQKELENESHHLKDQMVRPQGGRSDDELDALNKHIYVYEKLEKDIVDGEQEVKETRDKILPLTQKFEELKRKETSLDVQLKAGYSSGGLGIVLIIAGVLLTMMSEMFLILSGIGLIILCIGVYLIISRRTLRGINNKRLQEASGDLNALQLGVVASERKSAHGKAETEKINELYHVSSYPELVSLKDRWLKENMSFASDEKIFANRQEQLKKLTDKLVMTEKAILGLKEKREAARVKVMAVTSYYQEEDPVKLAEVRDKLIAFEQMKRDLKGIQVRLNDFLSGRSFEELGKFVEEGKLVFGSEGISEDEVALLENEQVLQDKLNELEKTIAAIRSEGDALARGHRPLAEIDEDITAETDMLEKMGRRKKVLETVQTTIDTITDELQHNFAPLLNQKVSEMVEHVTGDKYKDIKINPEMMMRLIDPKTNKTIDATQLSRGTMDLFYVALRDALASWVQNENELPLVLDETFAHFDNNRLEAALGLFGSRQGQVILFTCQEREIQLAGEDVHVIRL